MRKYISVILILIFLLNYGGYYLWFNILQCSIHKEIRLEKRRGIKDEELSLIVVSDNNATKIHWTKPNKEFRYKGEMYDIVKIKIQDQKRFYYCINDIKEKHLIANFNKNHKTKKQEEKKLKRIINYKFFPQQFTLLVIINALDLYNNTIFCFYKSCTIDIHIPPPKSA